MKLMLGGRRVEIGSKIKKSRIDAKLTQEQAAETLGISRQTISNWENEKSYPDIVSVLKMSDLYGVSLDYLLKGDSPMKNYLDYIEESTNVVKSKVKLSKLILILSYLVIWAFNIMVSWLFSAESISEAQAGAFQWLVLPVATIVISLPFFIIQLSGSRSFPLTSCAFSALFLSRCSIASCFHTFPHLRLSEATQNPCPLCRLSPYRGTR